MIQGQIDIDEAIEIAETGADGRLPHNFDRLRARRVSGLVTVVAERNGAAARRVYTAQQLIGSVDAWRLIYAELDQLLDRV